MFEVQCAESTSSNNDNMTQWIIIGIARMFGFWPFANKLTTIDQLKLIKFTACDCVRLVIIFGIYSVAGGSQIYSVYILTYGMSLFVITIQMCIILIVVLSTLSNIPICFWNRNNLLRIIANNLEFDIQVSVPM